MSLLSSIEEIKEVAAVNLTLDYSSIAPYIRQAERKYIKDILGATLYNQLQAHYDSSSSSSSSTSVALSGLLEEVQIALANLGLWLYLTHVGPVQISDSGITEAMGNDQRGARKFILDAINDSHKQTAFDELDRLLEYLEVNVGSFPDWKASSSYTIYKDRLLYRTSLFQTYYPINDSRRVFLQLKPFIKAAETQSIINIIGKPLYDAILAEIQGNSVSPENEKLLEYIREATVYTCLHKALPVLSLKLTDRGLTLDGLEAGTDSGTVQKPADGARINALIRQIESETTRSLSALKDFLEANASTYPLYTVSTLGRVDQSDKSVFFF